MDWMRVKAAEKSTSITANIRKTKQEAFAQFCRDQKYVQADALGGLIDWFMGLDKTTRSLVMDAIEKQDRGAVTLIALTRVANAEGVEVDAVKAVRQGVAKRILEAPLSPPGERRA